MTLFRTLSPVLLLASLAGTAHAASARADAIGELNAAGRHDVAQLRCERLSAHLSDTKAELREVCAEAAFEEALEVNTVMNWIRFQQVWRGTSYAKAARDNEAAAALGDLGGEAEEHEYASFIREYKDTKYALAAKQMISDAAIRDVKTPQEAVRVAQMFPDHKNTPRLVEKFLPAFLKMEMNGLDVKVSIEPNIPIPGPPPTGRWAVKTGEEAYKAWPDAAETHLTNIGVNPTFIRNATKDGIPPCQVPGADWELGVLVELGSGKAFFPKPGMAACAGRSWPAFTVLDDKRLAALSIGPGHVLTFPTDAAAGSFEWGIDGDKARIWSPGAAGDPVLVGGVIGQPVGNLWLLTPLAGGMPWYVNQGPPNTAMKVPIEARSTELPSGWTLAGARGPVQPGTRVSGEVSVEAGSLAGTPWKLPGGEVRVISPLVQQVTGLNRENEALKAKRKPRLPIITGKTGPMGATPVTMTQLDAPNGEAVGRQLSQLGIPVRVWRAWEGRISGTSGAKEIVFDGEIAGKPIKGLLDPMNTGVRVYVWERDARAQQGPEDVLSFVHDGATYFVWVGKNDKGDYNEAIHFDDVGLVREFR